MKTRTFSELWALLFRPDNRSRTSRTIEAFGWLILVESNLMLLAPHAAAALLHLPALTEQAAHYFQLVGLLVGGLGMLYVVSRRLDAEGFIFASLLDRPLVPIVMILLWHWQIVPGPLALAFALQDGLSFAWTLLAWRADRRHRRPGAETFSETPVT
jgi:hypothetical protein